MLGTSRPRWTSFASLVTIPLVLAGCPFPTTPTDSGLGPNAPLNEIQQSLANRPPVANAGSDQNVTAGERVVLNGTGSYDPDGGALTYFWQQTDEHSVNLKGRSSALAHFDAPTDITGPTTLTFRLLVRDGFASSVDDVQVTVSPAP